MLCALQVRGSARSERGLQDEVSVDWDVCSLQEFHGGGEKDVMLEEIANLRD